MTAFGRTFAGRAELAKEGSTCKPKKQGDKDASHVEGQTPGLKGGKGLSDRPQGTAGKSLVAGRVQDIENITAIANSLTQCRSTINRRVTMREQVNT